MNHKNPLRVPCSYQGGKQRVSKEIVDSIFSLNPEISKSTRFYDLCCGSGAISLELINRGINPKNIIMLDASSWGAFWHHIGKGKFSTKRFKDYIDEIPTNKRYVREHMIELSQENASIDEPYKYLLLQASSFGGKQIWREDEVWKNAFFRSYWEPTETSVRRSPANPIQPSPLALYDRVARIAETCQGVTGLNADISAILNQSIPKSSIIYIDPPYKETTGYGFKFTLSEFLQNLKKTTESPIFVSEGHALAQKSRQLVFGGAKGGISGNKNGKHEEWLSLV